MSTFQSELDGAMANIVDGDLGLGVTITLTAPDAAAFDFATGKPSYPPPAALVTVNAALGGERPAGRGGRRISEKTYLVRVADVENIDASATPDAGWKLAEGGEEYQVTGVEVVMAGAAYRITAERAV